MGALVIVALTNLSLVKDLYRLSSGVDDRRSKNYELKFYHYFIFSYSERIDK